MRWVQGRVVVLLAGVVAGSGVVGSAQVKRPKPPPIVSACTYVSKAEAEKLVGVALQLGPADPKGRSCRYLEDGFGVDKGQTKQVSIGVFKSDFQSGSDVKVRLGTIADDHSLEPMLSRELPNFADDAIWVWAGGYLGALYAFKDGTTEVVVKISGVSEAAALAAAKKFAARALGGAGRSGYKYAAPDVTMAESYYMAEILRPLYEGEFERVRDDEQARRYVMALRQGLNGACPGATGEMPEETALMAYGFHSAWNAGLKADAAADYAQAFAGQMERLKKSSPEILREGNADAVRFVKENAEKSGCMTPPVQHLYKVILEVAGERERVLPVDWR